MEGGAVLCCGWAATGAERHKPAENIDTIEIIGRDVWASLGGRVPAAYIGRVWGRIGLTRVDRFTSVTPSGASTVSRVAPSAPFQWAFNARCHETRMPLEVNLAVATRPVTCAQIAKEAGVSRSTVSIVIRGESKERNISNETTQRVLDAAKRLNYRPNQAARNLRTRRTGMIGVTVANLSWNWADTVLRGMSEVFTPAGYTPFVAVHRFDAELAHEELLSCLQRRDEGVVCQPMPGEAELYHDLINAGVPLVFLGDRPAEMPEVNSVGWDAAPAVRCIVRHLIEIGRRRIGFVGVDYPMEMTRARYVAYRETLDQAQLRPADRWVAITPMDWDVEHIVSWSLDRFLDGGERPDAVLALNDGLALPLLEELSVRGIRVPEDIAVAGMGDLPLTGHRGISLTTVREPTLEMGREAAQLMLDLIKGRAEQPVHRLIESQELRIRRTTDPAALSS